MRTSLLCWILFPALVWAQYPIGHRNITFVDSSRANRQVLTDVYYPATSVGDNTPVAVPPAGGFPVISLGHGFLLNVATYQYVFCECDAPSPPWIDPCPVACAQQRAGTDQTAFYDPTLTAVWDGNSGKI